MNIHPDLLEHLENMEVFDENGNTIMFSSLWKDKKTVMVFIRHFGCAISRWQIAELAKHTKDFEERDAQVMVIGNGKPDHIASFRNITGFKQLMFTDPELKSFKALNLEKSLGSMLGIKSFAAGIWSIGSGFGGVKVQGNVFQQGGALIADSDNNIHYYYKNKEAGDNPPVQAMLKACEI